MNRTNLHPGFVIPAGLCLSLLISTPGCGAGSRAPASTAQRLLFQAEKYTFSKEMNSRAAIDSFAKAIELDPRLPEAHAGLGIVYLNMGMYDPAKSHLEAAMGLCPNCLLVRQGMGRLLMASGDYGAARKHFQVIGDLYPENSLVHCAIGITYLFEGNFEAAERSYRRTLEIHGESLQATTGLIGVLVIRERLSEAKSLLGRLERLYSRNPYLKWGAGLIALMEGEIGLARALFEENLRRDATSPENRLFLGLACLLMDSPAEAEAHFLDLIGREGGSLLLRGFPLVDTPLARTGMVLVRLLQEDPAAAVGALNDIDGLMVGEQPAWKILPWVISKIPPDKSALFSERLKYAVDGLPEGEMREGLSREPARP